MPIPQPKPDEKQDDFISRCMGDKVMVSDYGDNKQRAAVCHQTWRDRHKKTVSTRIAELRAFLASLR